MTKHVLISAVAEKEIERAAAWHEAKQVGLSQDFYNKVLEAIRRIEENPEVYAKVFGEARRVHLQKFTAYALWFKILKNNSLIIACLSSKRNPRLAVKRAFGVMPVPEP